MQYSKAQLPGYKRGNPSFDPNAPAHDPEEMRKHGPKVESKIDDKTIKRWEKDNRDTSKHAGNATVPYTPHDYLDNNDK